LEGVERGGGAKGNDKQTLRRRPEASGTKTNSERWRERDAACVLALSLLRTVAQAGLPVLLKGKGAGQRPAVRKATATFGGGSGGELKACAGEAAQAV